MRRLSALLAALLSIVSTARAQTPTAYSYDFRLDPGEKASEIVHGTVRVSGSRGRVDSDDKKHGDDRTYFLLRDGGRTVYVVHPDRQEYEVHDADKFARVVGMALKSVGPVLNVSVSDVKLDTARLGGGDKIVGHATQRVRLRQTWRTSLKVFGFGKEDMKGSAETEVWTDPSYVLMRNPLLDLVSTSMLALAATDRSFLDDADRARNRLYRGAPLRTEIRFTMGGREGDDMHRLSYEVTKILPGPVNEADLELPKGYRRVDSKTIDM